MNIAIEVVIQLMNVESVSFTLNFMIKSNIQKIDVDRKIILKGQFKSINAAIVDIYHLQ